MPVAIRPALVLDYTLPAAGAQNVDYTATRPFVVADYHAVVIAQDGAGSTGLQRNGVAILTALVTTGAAGTVVRASAGLAAAQYVIAAADVVRCVIVSGGGTLDVRAYAKVLPTVITGTAPGFTGAANNATNLT